VGKTLYRDQQFLLSLLNLWSGRWDGSAGKRRPRFEQPAYEINKTPKQEVN